MFSLLFKLLSTNQLPIRGMERIKKKSWNLSFHQILLCVAHGSITALQSSMSLVQILVQLKILFKIIIWRKDTNYINLTTDMKCNFIWLFIKLVCGTLVWLICNLGIIVKNNIWVPLQNLVITIGLSQNII